MCQSSIRIQQNRVMRTAIHDGQNFFHRHKACTLSAFSTCTVQESNHEGRYQLLHLYGTKNVVSGRNGRLLFHKITATSNFFGKLMCHGCYFCSNKVFLYGKIADCSNVSALKWTPVARGARVVHSTCALLALAAHFAPQGCKDCAKPIELTHRVWIRYTALQCPL